ncbi:hypothetical protein DX928_11700 [Bacillus swezeyi]|uniref:Uncharacterized protein n=1 Tax=Bacillus swezeyi TaxID=1925020 RepID=A0A5M8RWE0_9BACI|nr:hypothetical protein DX927_10145 [Bacillus swezeyi]KAA6474707.1 hypothetical protein DX928_11700 [Bacillus swezeyi]
MLKIHILNLLLCIVSIIGFVQIIMNKQFIANGIIYISIFIISLTLSIVAPRQRKNNNLYSEKN